MVVGFDVGQHRVSATVTDLRGQVRSRASHPTAVGARRRGSARRSSRARSSMNPGIAEHLGRRHGWTVLVDNDADLAALAEGWRGHGRGVRSHATLLAGEGLGAGVVDDGRLLRGALVDGVGSTAAARVAARGEVVTIGARAALDHVRRNAVDITLPGRYSIRR